MVHVFPLDQVNGGVRDIEAGEKTDKVSLRDCGNTYWVSVFSADIMFTGKLKRGLTFVKCCTIWSGTIGEIYF